MALVAAFVLEANRVKPIAVLDLETDPFKKFRSPQPFLAGWFNGERTRTFWGEKCIEQCWQSMRKELRGHYIYAHNGGKFDFRYFLPYLAKESAKVIPIKGRMARFVLEDGTEFRDSFCLLPVPLKATGEKQEIDYRKFEKDRREKHREEIIAYWKQDLRALFDKVQEFVSVYGFGMTMAGRTFEQLKTRFDVHPPKANEFHDRQFRRFYYGGRVQFFRLGQCPGVWRVFDINSAYPHAMMKEHAFGLEFEDTEPKLPRDTATLERCFVRFTGESKGGLPWRQADKSLSFAPHAGEFFVTGWELVAAREAGAVRVDEVLECLKPTECRDFSRFVEFFYKQKREAVKGSSEELFAKLFLNSAYGRFALNPREFKDTKMTPYREEPEENEEYRTLVRKLVEKKHPEIKGEAFRLACAETWEAFEQKWTLTNDFEDIGVSVWERPVEVRSNSFFNVATAASITGCVRAHLFRSLRAVREPVYCDTDSIICRDPGTLKIGRELGEWKEEAESKPGGLWIAGRKLYALEKKGGGWKLASKGVRLSPREIQTVANGEAVKSTLHAPTFSLYTTRSARGSKADFITRTIVRDDKRKRRGA